MQEVLDKHNLYRCLHDVPALQWDDGIAASAQAWADQGEYKNRNGAWADYNRRVNGESCGENIAWGNRSGVDATAAWYSEIECTEPRGTPHNMWDSTNKSKCDQVGHYAQIVWAEATKLGCGKGTAIVNGRGGDFWVCWYSKPHTFSSFEDNVLAPTKAENDCEPPPTPDAEAVATTNPTESAATICVAVIVCIVFALAWINMQVRLCRDAKEEKPACTQGTRSPQAQANDSAAVPTLLQSVPENLYKEELVKAAASPGPHPVASVANVTDLEWADAGRQSDKAGAQDAIPLELGIPSNPAKLVVHPATPAGMGNEADSAV